MASTLDRPVGRSPPCDADRQGLAAVRSASVLVADVFRSRLLTVFGVLVLLKGVDLAGRGADWRLLAAWCAAGAAVVLGHRWALLAVSVLSVVVFAAGFENQHMWLLIWMPVTFLFPARDRMWLWRWQATILYGFAAVAKLNPDYLSGAVLGRRFDAPVVVLVVLSIGGLATEAFLAYGLWRWEWAKLLGVGFHTVVVVVMAVTPLHVVRLAVFAGLVLVLYSAFRHHEPTRIPGVVSLTIEDGSESPSVLNATTR